MIVDNDLIKQIKITPLLDTLQLEDISDEEYFSKKYKTYISNSRLGLLKTKGAEAFFRGFVDDGIFNASFDFGDKCHKLVLQPECYELIDTVFKPTAKAGVVADYLYRKDGIIPTDDEIKSGSYICNYYRQKLTPSRLIEFRQKAETYWRDRYLYEQHNPFKEGDKERLYTDEKSVELLKNCLAAIDRDSAIQKLLHPKGLCEDPYIACEKTILLDVEAEVPGWEKRVYKLKAKLDNFSIDKEEGKIVVNDLKTTSRLANDFDPAFFSYEREIAGYSWLLKLCVAKFFNMPECEIKGNFLVVSTIPDYQTCVYPMNPKMFRKGWSEYSYLLKTVAYLNIVKGYDFVVN